MLYFFKINEILKGFNLEEKNIQSWIKFAEEDLSTAEWCLQGDKLLWAMTMCQQAIEKIIKALYIKNTDKIPEKTHNLIKLAKDTDIISELSEETKNLFDDLLIYYFASRYPDKRCKLKADCTKEYTKNVFKQTKEVYSWIKIKL